MNILIVVGLLLVGIAAIIGVVLISINDQRKEVAQSSNLKQEREIRASAHSTPAQLTHPTEPREVVPTKQLELEEPTVTMPLHSSASLNSLTTLEGAQQMPPLNGQFHELANEVRSLHQQASQLEQRLSILTEMINHLEGSQSNDFDEEEQTHVPSENTLA